MKKSWFYHYILIIGMVIFTPELPVRAQNPINGERPAKPSSGTHIYPQRHIVEGQIYLSFHSDAINYTFKTTPRSVGWERIRFSESDQNLVKRLPIVKLQRQFPYLEVREKNQIRVLTDEEYRKLKGKKARPNHILKLYKAEERQFIAYFSPDYSPNEICARFEQIKAVEYCSVLEDADRLQLPVFPNDPELESQWGFHQESDFDIDAPEAWEIQKGSPDLLIAILDSGVDIKHEDIYERIWINTGELPERFVEDANGFSSDNLPDTLTFRDFNPPVDHRNHNPMQALMGSVMLRDSNETGYIDGEDLLAARDTIYEVYMGLPEDGEGEDPYPGDVVGWNFNDNTPIPFDPAEDHGTSVAGLIAATTDNEIDVAGMNWNSFILPVFTGSTAPQPRKALDYALEMGADLVVSSTSFGADPNLYAQIQELAEANIPMVVSLGNVGAYRVGTRLARSPYGIGVSNFQRSGRAEETSSFSVNNDIAAPGTGMASLAADNEVTIFSGSSAASPVLGGVISLLMSQRPGLTPEQYRQILRLSSHEPPEEANPEQNFPGFDYHSGWGMVNARSGLDLLMQIQEIAEAKLLMPPDGYLSENRREQLHLIGESLVIRVIAGIPESGLNLPVMVVHAPGAPPIDEDAWVEVYSQRTPYLRDAPLVLDGGQRSVVIDRDQLATGINSIRLEVTSGGRSYQDFGRIDVPHAYLDIIDGSLMVTDLGMVRGFAFHPDFDHYLLQAAPTHEIDDLENEDWVVVVPPIGEPRIPEQEDDGTFIDGILFERIPFENLPRSQEVTLRLAVRGANGRVLAQMMVPIVVDVTVFPEQNGFPAEIENRPRTAAPVVYDLNGDGLLELIVNTTSHIYVFQHDGRPMPDWHPRRWFRQNYYATPAVGDIDGDGFPEIVIRATEHGTHNDILHVYRSNGEQMEPWPLALGTRSYQDPINFQEEDLAPVLADLDNDGDLEILIAGGTAVTDRDSPIFEVNGRLLAFQEDGSLWRIYGAEIEGAVSMLPVVGDLDANGELDLAWAASGTEPDQLGILQVWQANGSPWENGIFVSENFPFVNLALANMDQDADLEIITCQEVGLTKIFNIDSSLLPGWEGGVRPAGARQGFLALGDLSPNDDSTAPDIVIAYYRGFSPNVTPHLTVYQANGIVLPGWEEPFSSPEMGLAQAQPSIFDLDEDPFFEILFGTRNHEQVPFRSIWGLNHDGTDLADDDERFPLFIEQDLWRAPVIADLDGDGDWEVSLVSNQTSGPVHVFDLNAPVRDGGIAWGMNRHNPQRTSNYHDGLRLLEPTTSRFSNVGSPVDANLRKPLLIRLVKELPFGEIRHDNLTVKINGVEAEVIGFSKVEGEYWVIVNPPRQDASGNYLLELIWDDGGILRVTRQVDAVRYHEEQEPVDHILLTDTSGSMNHDDKYLAARTAASFYVSALADQDRVGLVTFNTHTVDQFEGLLELNEPGNRDRIGNIVNEIIPEPRDTSIGGGLLRALAMLDNSQDRTRSILLLSDGLENSEPFWKDGENPVWHQFLRQENSDIRVHTIALGEDADRELHGDIAEETGGQPRFVYIGNSLSIFGRLSESYKRIEEDIYGDQRIFTKGENIARDESKMYRIVIPEGTMQVKFAVSFRHAVASVYPRIFNSERQPIQVEGNLRRSPTSWVFTLPNPQPGAYEMEISVFEQEMEVLSTVSAKLPVHAVARFGHLKPVGPQRTLGIIQAGLIAGPRFPGTEVAPTGFLKNTSQKLRITAPDRTEEVIDLADMGESYDGLKGDGIFGSSWIFDQYGGYQLTVITTLGEGVNAVTVEKRIGYFHNRPKDVDGDGLDDKWERGHYPNLSLREIHPYRDSDRDGLKNREEYRYGTDPNNHDSDNDQKPDGEEVVSGTNPLLANSSHPREGDTDADYLPDNWEKLHFPKMSAKEVSASADPDQDGLSNYTESRLGTDPNRWDSNGNRISDLTESHWQIAEIIDRQLPTPPTEPITVPKPMDTLKERLP